MTKKSGKGSLTRPRGERVLVTGGTGFIGTALVEELLKDDNQVVIIDSRRRDALKHTKLEGMKNLTILKGDILDKKALASAMEGCDRVFHLAAIAGIDTVALRPSDTMKVNFLGTVAVIDAALACKSRPKRVVCFSTSEVYGPRVYRGREDDMTTQGPVGVFRWTYAVSKLAAEHWAHSFGKDEGLDVTSVRPFNVYGPRQVGEGALRKFVAAAVKNEEIVVHGDGNQIRAWCYISDMVEGTLRASVCPAALANAYNIGNSTATATIYGLAERVVALAGSRSKIVFKKWDQPDVEIRVPSVEKARVDLGYEAKVGLEEGIARTIEWFRENL